MVFFEKNRFFIDFFFWGKGVFFFINNNFKNLVQDNFSGKILKL